jgi:hypothetical protein
MSNPSEIAEQRNAVAHLRANGFSPLLAALEDPRCYTRDGRGRLVLAAVAKRLQVSWHRAASMLEEARQTVLR